MTSVIVSTRRHITRSSSDFVSARKTAIVRRKSGSQPHLVTCRDMAKLRASLKTTLGTLLTSGTSAIHLVQAPPGSGKSYIAAEIGAQLTKEGHIISWIAQRYGMEQSIEALNEYTIVQGCSRSNCDHYETHSALSVKGYNTFRFHKTHRCTYYRQFQHLGSAVFQMGFAHKLDDTTAEK